MKKIGIITFHSAHNYGAMLQVYALQKKINEYGKAEVINYRNKEIDKNYRVLRLSKKSPVAFVKSFVGSVLYFNKNKKRYKSFNTFMKEKLSLTEIYHSENELKKRPPCEEIYITGSDQVWNTKITNGLKDSYTLNFGENKVKRISYAASVGNGNLTADEKKKFLDKLSRIDFLSVREETGKKCLIDAGIKKDIKVVLDPTLIITKEEWEKEIENVKKEDGDYILAYIVEEDDNYYEILNKLSKITGLKVIHFSKKNKQIDNVKASKYTEGPLEFVSLIKNAKYVVCTSFHATVFSIIFNKKFWVIPHKTTGSRVNDLLNGLNLKDRIVRTIDDFDKKEYDANICYDEVDKILNEKRTESIKWLYNAINN